MRDAVDALAVLGGCCAESACDGRNDAWQSLGGDMHFDRLIVSVALIYAFASAQVLSSPTSSNVPVLSALPSPGSLFPPLVNPNSDACDAGLGQIKPVPPPIVHVDSEQGDTPAGDNLFQAVGEYGPAMLAGRPVDGATAKAALLAWAKADALRTFVRNESGQWWTIYTLLPQALILVEQLEKAQALTPEEDATIKGWFRRLMATARIGAELGGSKRIPARVSGA